MEERSRRGARAKRQENRKKQIMKITRYIILYAIIAILIYMAYGFYIEAKVRTVKEGNNNNLVLAEQNTQTSDGMENGLASGNQQEQNIAQDFVPVSAKYEGYAVDCRLEVPKIDLNTNVLADYCKAGLKVCASKYYGPNANEAGNYCIAGHNYQKKNMFNHLIDLNIGDSVFITDNTNGKVEYTIYDIYKVKPENIEPLSQKTRGEKEVTLITCVNYSQNRLVIKAIEKKT